MAPLIGWSSVVDWKNVVFNQSSRLQVLILLLFLATSQNCLFQAEFQGQDPQAVVLFTSPLPAVL